MQAVILAAGRGTRLYPITKTRTKAMCPVAGKPIVERVMDTLVANGISEFILVISPDDSDITEYFTHKSTIDARVREPLIRMASFVTSAQNYSMTVNFGNEGILKDGQRIELGALFKVDFARPNKARISIENRTGESSIIVLDGDSLSVLAKTDAALLYDQVDQPGDVDHSLKYLNQVLGTNDQIRHFFSIELMTRLSKTIESGLYLGESKIVGTICEHLALRTDDLDVQVWIPKMGKPLPFRMVATYREIEGQPQFWADFIEWDFSPNFGPDFFEFIPPESAKQVDFFESD